MYNEYDPVVGNWYQRMDTEEQFQVTAFDEDDGVIEIQYFEAEVEEIDLDNWQEMDIQLIEAPIDWSGPMDDDPLEYGGGGETPEETEAQGDQ